MKIYITLDTQELDEVASVADPMTSAISEWIIEAAVPAELVNQSDVDATTNKGLASLTLGIYMTVKKSQHLKKPLNFFYTLAKQHKVEFVLGYFDDDFGESEDICYFGYEEGQPDIFEVGSYLGFGY